MSPLLAHELEPVMMGGCECVCGDQVTVGGGVGEAGEEPHFSDTGSEETDLVLFSGNSVAMAAVQTFGGPFSDGVRVWRGEGESGAEATPTHQS